MKKVISLCVAVIILTASIAYGEEIVNEENPSNCIHNGLTLKECQMKISKPQAFTLLGFYFLLGGLLIYTSQK